jgi:hypothetical protein
MTGIWTPPERCCWRAAREATWMFSNSWQKTPKNGYCYNKLYKNFLKGFKTKYQHTGLNNPEKEYPPYLSTPHLDICSSIENVEFFHYES